MFAFAIAAALAAAPAAAPCTYDRDRLLSLDQKAFDQDLEGGWRALANDPRCWIAAADLLRDYRQLHQSTASILFWHEGQLRANAGQTAAAIALFEQSRAKEPDPFGWNFYVDGTIAFLRHDRAGLQAARDKLAAVPKPADFHPIGPNGKPMEIKWPPNLNVLDGFLTCFDRPYDVAYGRSECTRPMGKISVPDR
jgi:hypothetical protein